MGCEAVRGRVREARPRGEMARGSSVTDLAVLADGRAGSGATGDVVGPRRRRCSGQRGRLRSSGAAIPETGARATLLRAEAPFARSRVQPSSGSAPEAGAIDQRSCVDDHPRGSGEDVSRRPAPVRPRRSHGSRPLIVQPALLRSCSSIAGSIDTARTYGSAETTRMAASPTYRIPRSAKAFLTLTAAPWPPRDLAASTVARAASANEGSTPKLNCACRMILSVVWRPSALWMS